MPLGYGHTTEEQLSGKAEWGGLQIAVAPLRAEVWQAEKEEWEERQRKKDEELVATLAMEAYSDVPKAARALSFAKPRGSLRWA